MMQKVHASGAESIAPHVRVLMQALAVPQSVTNHLAVIILERRGMMRDAANSFLSLLRCTNFVELRNEEWAIERTLRLELMKEAHECGEFILDIHELLLKLTASVDNGDQLWPAYLATKSGRAYHLAACGKTREALELYGEVASSPDPADIWLSGRLSMEQQSYGVLPMAAPEPKFLLALSVYREGKRAESYLLFEEVARASEVSLVVGRALVFCSELDVARGDLELAEERLTRAVKIFEELRSNYFLVTALRYRALLYKRMLQFSDALKDISRAIELSQGDRKARMLAVRASVMRDIEDPQSALIDLDEAVALARIESLPFLLTQRAGLKRELNRCEDAVVDINRAVDITGEHCQASLLNTRASLFADLGFFESAEQDLSRAEHLSLPNEKATILSTRASIRTALGDIQGCIDDLEKILQLPEDQQSSVDVLRIVARRKSARSLQRRLNAARNERESQVVWFKYFLFWAGRNQSNVFRRIAIYKQALLYAATNEEYGNCYYLIGSVYEVFGDYPSAIDNLRRAEEYLPDNSKVLATLARALHLNHADFDVTADLFERAIDRDPQNRWAKSWYALVLAERGLLKRAEALAAEAVLESDHPILLYNFAVVLDMFSDQGHKDLAIAVAEKSESLALDSFSEVREFLSERKGPGNKR